MPDSTPPVASLRELAHCLRSNPELASEFNAAVHEHLFTQILASRAMFPLNTTDAHGELPSAMAWVLERAGDDGTLPDKLGHRLRELGRDHRRHGFPNDAYEVFARSLEHGFAALPLTPEVRDAANQAAAEVCTIMADAAHASDLAGQPPAHAAQVVAVEHPNRQTTVVRLETGMPVDFHPGQHIPVTTPHLPGTWRYLTPASPADTTGQLVFHITTAGDASSMLAKARPGDMWTLGTPRGEFINFPGFNLVLISYGAGWAAVRPYLVSLVEAARAAGSSAGFGCSVYAVAPSPGSHYDTAFQANLHQLAPWITLHHIVRAAEDPWLLGAQELDPSIEMTVAEEPIDAVLATEKVSVSNFVLVGPAERVEAGHAALVKAGVDPGYIEKHPWQRGAEWPEP